MRNKVYKNNSINKAAIMDDEAANESEESSSKTIFYGVGAITTNVPLSYKTKQGQAKYQASGKTRYHKLKLLNTRMVL